MVRDVSFGEAIALGFRKYFDFRGRAQRAEYWWWVLFTTLASIALQAVDAVTGFPVLDALFSLATIIPTLAVSWRRMHDIGRSGWWNFLVFIPIALMAFAMFPLFSQPAGTELEGFALILAIVGVVGTLAAAIYVLVLLVRDSDRGTNRFGPSPKYGSEMTVFD